MQLEIGWCERSEADLLENPLVFGQAYFQRACNQSTLERGLLRGRGAPLISWGGVGGAAEPQSP